jgi:phage portal protein BeeE
MFNFLQNWFNRSNNSYYTAQQIGNPAPQWINTTDKWLLYREIPELEAIINRYAKMVASANPVLLDEDGNKVDDHWFLQIIDRPNAVQTWGQMAYMIAINKAVTANVLVYAPKMKFNRVKSITPIAWNNVRVIQTNKTLKQIDRKGIISHFEMPNDFKSVNERFELDEVIYFCEPDGINLINTNSRIDTLRYPLSNIAAQYKKRNVLLNNLFSLGVLSSLKHDGVSSLPLMENDKKLLRDDLKRTHNGEILISEKPTTFTPMTFPVKDLMLFEELNADKIALIDAYGLNKHMFGSSDNKGDTFSNVEMGERQAYNSTIIPDTEIIYDEITRQLGLDKEGVYLMPDFSHISVMKDDGNKKAQEINIRSQAVERIAKLTTLTDDEIRRLLGI